MKSHDHVIFHHCMDVHDLYWGMSIRHTWESVGHHRNYSCTNLAKVYYGLRSVWLCWPDLADCAHCASVTILAWPGY